MINYFEELSHAEQEEVTQVIQMLYRQTFLLEKKYDKRSERFQFNKYYRLCGKHFEFLRDYFMVAGVRLCENTQAGIFYVEGEALMGERMPRLATLYLLLLKLIYDEKMSTASTSVQVYTTIGELNGKLGGFQILKERPSFTEMKRAFGLLKKYQIIEPLSSLEEFDGNTKLIIYPTIHAVLLGTDIRSFVESFAEEENEWNRQ